MPRYSNLPTGGACDARDMIPEGVNPGRSEGPGHLSALWEWLRSSFGTRARDSPLALGMRRRGSLATRLGSESGL
jgi:hypothetical protein